MQLLKTIMELGNTSVRSTNIREQYPLLLYFAGQKNQIFRSIFDPNVTYTSSILELGDSNLLTLQHGWCLMENVESNCHKLFLWNPCSLQKIKLPLLKTPVDIGDCVLSSSPTATDQVCDIFLFSVNTNSIFYCQLGDDQWTVVNYLEDLVIAMKAKKISLVRDKSFLTKPVYCNGCLYAESIGLFLVVIEKHGYRGLKVNPKLILMPTPQPTRFHRLCRLLESNNELFRIEILHSVDKIVSVAVYKFEFSRSVWEKVKNINDRVFFISYVYSPFACQASNLETEGGRIYFMLTNQTFVYIYNIEEDTITFFQPFPNVLEIPSYLMWFMSDIRMRADILRKERGKAKIKEKESTCGAIRFNKKVDTTGGEFVLPLDVVKMIAERLNGFDYLHFRATDKLFRLGAPPMLRFDDHSLCPLLVFFDKDNVFTFLHPKHSLKYKYTIKLPKFDFPEGNTNDDEYLVNSDFEICYSKNGWLLLTLNESCSFFFCPFTKEVKPFKNGPITTRSAKCVGFSHCPTSYKCVIVDFDESKASYFRTPIFRLVDDTARNASSFTFEHGCFSANRSPTFYNGSFYCLSDNGMLGVIKLTERGASWKEFNTSQSPCTDAINSFLVECNGNQLSVFEGPFGKWVRVFQLNESTMTWTKVESLGNHMLFVGNTSFSAVAKIAGMENKIYFPRFYGRSIVFYSLETKKYHTFEDEVVNFESVREPLNCSWIEPRWH